jgi:hypothetical protein
MLAKRGIASVMVSVGWSSHLHEYSSMELGYFLSNKETYAQTVRNLQAGGDIASALSLQERYLNCLVGDASPGVWKEEFQRFCDLYSQFRSVLVVDDTATADDDQLPNPPEVCLRYMEDAPGLSAAFKYYPHPSAKDLFGRSLLHLALYERGVEDVDVIIGNLTMRDLNSKDYFGRTPLHIAATVGDEDGVRKLLDAGASVNQREYADRLTPLQCAAAAGHPVVTKMILEALLTTSSIQKDAVTSQTQMALSLAARNGHLIVESLLDPERGLQEDGVHNNARPNTTILTPEIPGMLVVTDGSGYNSIAKLAVDWAEDISDHPESLG